MTVSEPRPLVAAAVIGGIVLVAWTTTIPAQQSKPSFAVTFSTPIEGEADVRRDTVIRIQFSRHVDERSLGGRVQVSYSATESAERGEAQPPPLRFSLQYDPGHYAIIITPAPHLERFREVHVDLLAGIVSADGDPLRPWTLRFNTGGSD